MECRDQQKLKGDFSGDGTGHWNLYLKSMRITTAVI